MCSNCTKIYIFLFASNTLRIYWILFHLLHKYNLYKSNNKHPVILEDFYVQILTDTHLHVFTFSLCFFHQWIFYHRTSPFAMNAVVGPFAIVPNKVTTRIDYFAIKQVRRFTRYRKFRKITCSRGHILKKNIWNMENGILGNLSSSSHRDHPMSV